MAGCAHRAAACNAAGRSLALTAWHGMAWQRDRPIRMNIGHSGQNHSSSGVDENPESQSAKCVWGDTVTLYGGVMSCPIGEWRMGG
ncbi:uncharacterized protein RCO7_14295 [Rhynchosporium graminicola]|uniref:Uncharacterized protein n=1 Tax=Rhynchosporium graminicola TaxID=2792576 RepID=A0A1E1K6V3_9HELO|nr:uncharacterized protein RCO7_14295 [Rhynchosporium commune]